MLFSPTFPSLTLYPFLSLFLFFLMSHFHCFLIFLTSSPLLVFVVVVIFPFFFIVYLLFSHDFQFHKERERRKKRRMKEMEERRDREKEGWMERRDGERTERGRERGRNLRDRQPSSLLVLSCEWSKNDLWHPNTLPPAIPCHPLPSPAIPCHPLSSPSIPCHLFAAPCHPCYPVSSPFTSLPLFATSIELSQRTFNCFIFFMA